MTVIAMTREMGSLGKEVAREFARRMNYTVVHHELTETGDARRERGEESEVYRFLEGSQEELDTWRGNRASGGYLTRAEVYEIALDGNVLIRGWGACRLLKSIPNVLSLRVCAPMAFRVRQMMARLGIGEEEARREIHRNDAAHSGIFMRFFGTDWADPLNYDLVLNTDHLSPPVCADILCDTVRSPAFAESDLSRRKLGDCLLEARIRSALMQDGDLARNSRHIDVAVSDKDVRLFGLVTNTTTRSAAERLVAAQEGVRAIHNDIAQAGRFD